MSFWVCWMDICWLQHESVDSPDCEYVPSHQWLLRLVKKWSLCTCCQFERPQHDFVFGCGPSCHIHMTNLPNKVGTENIDICRLVDRKYLVLYNNEGWKNTFPVTLCIQKVLPLVAIDISCCLGLIESRHENLEKGKHWSMWMWVFCVKKLN